MKPKSVVKEKKVLNCFISARLFYITYRWWFICKWTLVSVYVIMSKENYK